MKVKQHREARLYQGLSLARKALSSVSAAGDLAHGGEAVDRLGRAPAAPGQRRVLDGERGVESPVSTSERGLATSSVAARGRLGAPLA